MAELIDNSIQLLIVFACGIFSGVHAIKSKKQGWIFTALFYLSFGMGLTYWVLYIVLFNSAPQVFFVSELSWTAAYIFLAMSLVSDISEEEKKFKVGFLPWILPIFSFIMCIFFCLRGSYLENILMGTTMAICGFFAARGIIFAKQKNQKDRFFTCCAVLIFFAAEYLLWISSYFWIDDTLINPYFLTDTFILNPAIITVTAARYKGDKLCHII